MFQKYLLPYPFSEGRFPIEKEMKKGTAVVRKPVLDDSGEVIDFKFALPSTAEEAADYFGWVDANIEFTEHKESYYDMLPAGERTRCYLRTPNSAIKTTEFVGDLVMGDKCVIGYESSDAGKVRKAKTGETPTLIVEESFDAMTAYEFPIVAVRML